MVSEMPHRKDVVKEKITYPLEWPENWPRTPRDFRKPGDIQSDFVIAKDILVKELKLFGAQKIHITTNIRVDKDGHLMPAAVRAQVTDPGVVAKFQLFDTDYVLCQDFWTTVADNLRSLGQTVGFLRRSAEGGSKDLVIFLMDSAMDNLERFSTQGSCDLPPQAAESEVYEDTEEDIEPEVIQLTEETPWWEVLKVSRDASLQEVLTAHADLKKHASNSRDSSALYKLDDALSQAQKVLS